LRDPAHLGDVDALYAEMVKLATHRETVLDEKGYLPHETSSRGAGTTLEYGVADFALALIAEATGRDADAARWLANSSRWRNLFDASTGVGWIRPRHADGTWLDPFDPAADESGFQEGNSWQYSWLAPHDTAGVLDAMGPAVAKERLDHHFSLHPEVQTRATLFGLAYRTDQYAPGNEHDLQTPWQYATVNPAGAQRVLRDIQTIFRATPDGLPGNDDLGSLSASHVLSAIGFGPITPGAPLFVIGSPQFERIAIDVGGPAPFVVEAPGASLLNRYVTSATLNGTPLDRVWFASTALAPSGTLQLTMSGSANVTWIAPNRAPPSASTHSVSSFGCQRSPVS
jgi:predicted alpha-1,2-mannosidase